MAQQKTRRNSSFKEYACDSLIRVRVDRLLLPGALVIPAAGTLAVLLYLILYRGLRTYTTQTALEQVRTSEQAPTRATTGSLLLLKAPHRLQTNGRYLLDNGNVTRTASVRCFSLRGWP